MAAWAGKIRTDNFLKVLDLKTKGAYIECCQQETTTKGTDMNNVVAIRKAREVAFLNAVDYNRTKAEREAYAKVCKWYQDKGALYVR